jgi:acetyltransferase-like isoleucine patch superfamily enzyme
MRRKIKLLCKLAATLLPSRLRVLLMRRRGAVIGRGVSLGPLSLFECGKISIGDGCRIAAFTRFSVRGRLELGADVQVGRFTRITAAEAKIGAETVLCSRVTAGGDGRHSTLTTGPRCYIGDDCMFDLYCAVTLGEEVGIGRGSCIFTHGSWQSEFDGFPIASGEVRIGDLAWLGAGVTLFSGVEVGEFATVGGGTVMRRRVPPYSLATGNPGKVVLQNGAHLKHVSEDERFELCQRILQEMADHQEWLGCKVSMENSADHSRVSLNEQVLLFRRRIRQLESVNTAISFERMSDVLILQLEAADIDWFDMERRRCSRAMTGVNEVVRAAFSNHGVRFQTTARGTINDAPDKKRGGKPVHTTGEESSEP